MSLTTEDSGFLVNQFSFACPTNIGDTKLVENSLIINQFPVSRLTEQQRSTALKTLMFEKRQF